MTVFKAGKTNYAHEPIFFGNPVSTARYDVQTHEKFEDLISKQLGYFWKPEEVDISRDRLDYEKMSEAERHIFTSNLKYQTLLDSIQGRGPNLCALPIVSLPEAETWIETWSFSETIHSRSYTHILRGIMDDPSIVLDDITVNPDIRKRAENYTRYFDALIEFNNDWRRDNRGELHGMSNEAFDREHKKRLLSWLVATNALEAIAFYVSFACSFAFAEAGKMEGNAKIIKLIGRDEALHLVGTQFMLNLLRKSPMFRDIWDENLDLWQEIFMEIIEAEFQWADYLFSKGTMLGLNAKTLKLFVKYMANIRMTAVGFEAPYPDIKANPLPWIFENGHLSNPALQVAPQETEISDYRNDMDSNVSDTDVDDFDLGDLF